MNETSLKEPRIIKTHTILAKRKPSKRVLIGIPMTGMIRSEWHLAYVGMGIPTNWAHGSYIWGIDQFSPIQFSVANARNIIVNKAVTEEFEWLIFFDHDVILKAETLSVFNQYMLHEDIPIVGGLYFTKSIPAEPLLYRGRGNGYYSKFKLGDKVWCDGMGLGCHLINVKLLKVMWEESEEYEPMPGLRVRQIFDSPMFMEVDGKGKIVSTIMGTEDLPWYERIKNDKILKKAGWPDLQRKKYPFLCDTELFCKHIDWSGTLFPCRGEENKYT